MVLPEGSSACRRMPPQGWRSGAPCVGTPARVSSRAEAAASSVANGDAGEASDQPFGVRLRVRRLDHHHAARLPNTTTSGELQTCSRPTTSA